MKKHYLQFVDWNRMSVSLVKNEMIIALYEFLRFSLCEKVIYLLTL